MTHLTLQNDPKRREAIAGSMRRDGWVGRPLLAIRHGVEGLRPLECLTGSHRIAAALEVGLKAIPVVIVDCTQEFDAEPTFDPIDVALRYAMKIGPDFANVVQWLWDQEESYPGQVSFLV